MKICYFVDRLKRGGIQSLLLDICPALVNDGHEVTLLTLDDGNDYSELEYKFQKSGISFYKFNGIWIKNVFSYINYKNKLKRYFSTSNFDVIHINSGPKNYIVAKMAKKSGIKKVIYHSHNTDFQTKNKLQKIYGNFLKRKVIKYSNGFIGCSIDAGKWMFTDKILHSKNYITLFNPIKIENFQFDNQKRIEYRQILNLGNSFVMGNVGRLESQKNQMFLIEVFFELTKIVANVKLVIIGDGSYRIKIEDRINNLGIEDKVLLLGFKENISDLINAFDLYAMTSFHEGYPISAIEAQVNGLPFIMSDSITRDALINKNSMYYSLKKTPDEWAKTIYENFISCNVKRSSDLSLEEYTIQYATKKLIDFYCSLN